MICVMALGCSYRNIISSRKTFLLLTLSVYVDRTHRYSVPNRAVNGGRVVPAAAKSDSPAQFPCADGLTHLHELGQSKVGQFQPHSFGLSPVQHYRELATEAHYYGLHGLLARCNLRIKITAPHHNQLLDFSF